MKTYLFSTFTDITAKKESDLDAVSTIDVQSMLNRYTENIQALRISQDAKAIFPQFLTSISAITRIIRNDIQIIFGIGNF